MNLDEFHQMKQKQPAMPALMTIRKFLPLQPGDGEEGMEERMDSAEIGPVAPTLHRTWAASRP